MKKNINTKIIVLLLAITSALTTYSQTPCITPRILGTRVCNPLTPLVVNLYCSPNIAGASYQWYLNNSLVLGANSQNFTATSSGYYSVSISYNNCNNLSEPVEVNQQMQAFPTWDFGTEQNHYCPKELVKTYTTYARNQINGDAAYLDYSWYLLMPGGSFPGTSIPCQNNDCSYTTFSAPGNPGTYQVVCIATNGCDSKTLVKDFIVDNCECPECPPKCPDECYWTIDGNNIYTNGKERRNIFGTLSKDQVRIKTSNSDRGVFTNDGRLGWNTKYDPIGQNTITTLVHINCNATEPWMKQEFGSTKSAIRFEDLQKTDNGEILIQDKDGYVYNSGISIRQYLKQKEIQEQIIKANEELRKELLELKTQMKTLMTKQNVFSADTYESNLEISPNPFTNHVKVNYSIASFSGNAEIRVTDINGKIIKSIPVKISKGSVDLEIKGIAQSFVNFTLIDSGKILLTKKGVKI